MATYKELQDQISTLKRESEEARKNEKSSAISEIREKMKLYGITTENLTSSKSTKNSKVKSQVATKYLDSETGNTWTGRGRQPHWLAGKDKEKFLVR